MTTIVYKSGILASDSSAVVGTSVAYISTYDKIRISACKHFGYGISGSIIDPNWISDFEVNLLAFFMAHRDGFGPTLPIPKVLLDTLDGRDWIIITKDSAYTRGKRADGVHRVSRLLDDEFCTIGTGRDAAMVACLAGKTAEEAVGWGIKLDYYTYPSKVLTIKHSQLKAFPKEIKA
jgi:hypothetical protein